MLIALSLLLVIIFLTLGLIHINWAFGGQWGFEAALPTKEDGKFLFKPRKVDSAAVGLGLLAFALFYLLKSDLLNLSVPVWVEEYGGWLIPAIFALRAIGDFKYVGFFKKVKKTEFGKKDSRIFAPLCLSIALIGFIVFLLS